MSDLLLTTREEIGELLDDVSGAMQVAHGVPPDSECMRVAAATCEFSGWRYRITRELLEGFIDCSTLVSQSTWLGAGIGTPFIAESQRTALSGLKVEPAGILPGDVLIRHQSARDAPDGRHNHVGLYLGEDAAGVGWLIESSPHSGTHARPYEPGWAAGGVRRFLPNPTIAFPHDDALWLARAVPKLGRLGARLTVGWNGDPRHRGVDVYFHEPVDLVAPVAGRLELIPDGVRPGLSTAVLHAGDDDALVIMKPIRASGDAAGHHVDIGAHLGELSGPGCWGCNVIPQLRRFAHLHIEYWARDLPYFPERGLQQLERRRPQDGRVLEPYNPIYAMKLGLISSPATDTGSLVSLPLAAPSHRT